MLQQFKESVRSNRTIFHLGLKPTLPCIGYDKKKIVKHCQKALQNTGIKNKTLQNQYLTAIILKLLHNTFKSGKEIYNNFFQILRKNVLAQKLCYFSTEGQYYSGNNYLAFNFSKIREIDLTLKPDFSITQ